MTTALAVLFSFNEAVLMVVVFAVLFGLPLFTIFKRMKMEDRRLEAKKKVRRTPPPETLDAPRPAPPTTTTPASKK